MSAICGIVRLDGAPVDAADLAAMAASSPHRGPDGTRFHVEGNAGLAHLAFRVTPESVHERQPLVSDDGRLVLVADVRIDNRPELAGKLGIDHESLRAMTDPELLLRAYENWGERCVEHLLGDFAFAVWDARSRELFLARDPLGAYGLTWHRVDQRFVFASETTAILDLPFVNARINRDAIAKTLAYLDLGEDETYFEGIHYLAPAHCMHVAADRIRSWKYWQIDEGARIGYRNDEEYTGHFLELLERAVACRLRSLGPVGISLSGGHDSTLLAAVASRQLSASGGRQQRLHSFSCVFDRFGECDERKYIEPVVDQYDIDATYVDADALWTFAKLHAQEIPRDFLWTNAYSQLPEAIAGAARDAGCRVLIDGMFGDALFAEPSLFAADLLRQGRFAALHSLFRLHRRDMSWRRDVLDHGLRQLLPAWLRRAYRRLKPAAAGTVAPGLRAHWLRRADELRHASHGTAVDRRLSPGKRSRCARMLQPDWAQGFAATRGIPYNRCGIERVSPYFDRRLVEFVLAIPTEQLSHPGRPRKLQNDAMRRLLPEAVHQRRGKTGFEPLIRCGLLEREKATVRRLAQDSLMVKQGWIAGDWLENQVRDEAALERDGYYLSVCLHLELWLRAIQGPLSGAEKWAAPYVHPPAR